MQAPAEHEVRAMRPLQGSGKERGKTSAGQGVRGLHTTYNARKNDVTMP